MLSTERIRERINESTGVEKMKENFLKENIYTYRKPINFSENGMMLVYNSDDVIGKNRKTEDDINCLIYITTCIAFYCYCVVSPEPRSVMIILFTYVYISSLRYSLAFLRWMDYSDVAHSMLIDSQLHNVYLTLPFDHNAPRIVPIHQIVKQPLKDMNDALKYICVGVDDKSYLFETAGIADLTLFNTIIDPQVFAITLGDEGNQNLNSREEERP